MKTKPNSVLGQFEQLVLTSIIALGEDQAYGLAIQRRVTELYGGKGVNLGSVYVTLDRPEAKKFIKSSYSDPRPERGGRPRRCYRVLPEGKRALQESITVQQRSLALLTEFWKLS